MRTSKPRPSPPPDLGPLVFNPPERDLIFDYGPALAGHANGMVLMALDKQGDIIAQETYFSIGGGFVLTEAEQGASTPPSGPKIPYPFESAAQMLEMAAKSGKSIAQMKRENERVTRSDEQIDAGIARIWQVMRDCMDRGLATGGILPGGLKVQRRAHAIHDRLLAERGRNDTAPHIINDWISTYAMAVNEENAAGGQVVTAPTNGAAGGFCLPRSAIGSITCQGGPPSARSGGVPAHRSGCRRADQAQRVNLGRGMRLSGRGRVAAAMAASGFAAVMGGTVTQVENAAEIALEHHLGMTCDPVRGLVQVPCIERNGLGAIKAVSAASLALRGDGTHFVPLDSAIETMRQTGADMNEKYKETSLGGLAVNIPNC